MSDDITEIRSALRSILADHSDSDAVLAAEADGWNAKLWSVLEQGGFSTISVDEAAGGSGGTLAEACAVLHELARSAASVPFAEHALLGGWLLSLGGHQLPEGIVTVIYDASALSVESSGAELTVSGEASHVPWLSAAQHVIAVLDVDGKPTAVMIPTSGLVVDNGANLAQEQRRHMVATSVAVPAENAWEVPADTVEQLRLRGALSRAALISGALERATELTVRYTGEREQFGRPIGRFQAVQRHVVRLAESAQQSLMATTVAAMNAGERIDFFDGASAKIVASECGSVGTQTAHQAHGAIGMTKEYELGQLSRRIWSWRDECGHERVWARELGERLASAGAEELWPRISTGLVGAKDQP